MSQATLVEKIGTKIMPPTTLVVKIATKINILTMGRPRVKIKVSTEFCQETSADEIIKMSPEQPW